MSFGARPTKYPSWPGLTRPPSRRASARLRDSFARTDVRAPASARCFVGREVELFGRCSLGRRRLGGRLTFAMIIGIPIVQLVLFGFAINSDPKHLPTALNVQDNSVFARSLTAAMQNTGYFKITHIVKGEREGEELLASGTVAFLL